MKNVYMFSYLCIYDNADDGDDNGGVDPRENRMYFSKKWITPRVPTIIIFWYEKNPSLCIVYGSF